MVHALAKLSALAIPEPANPRRQPLEMNSLPRKTNPTVQNLIFRKEFKYEVIRDLDVTRISGQRHPSEWSSSFGKHRADVGRDETGKVISVLYASLISHRADIVSVIKRDGTALLHIQHRLDVDRHGLNRPLGVTLRIAFAEFGSSLERQAERNISVQRIVRARLIRQYIRNASAADHFWQDFGAIPNQP